MSYCKSLPALDPEPKTSDTKPQDWADVLCKELNLNMQQFASKSRVPLAKMEAWWQGKLDPRVTSQVPNDFESISISFHGAKSLRRAMHRCP